jgi:hypothetical protein
VLFANEIGKEEHIQLLKALYESSMSNSTQSIQQTLVQIIYRNLPLLEKHSYLLLPAY